MQETKHCQVLERSVWGVAGSLFGEDTVHASLAFPIWQSWAHQPCCGIGLRESWPHCRSCLEEDPFELVHGTWRPSGNALALPVKPSHNPLLTLDNLSGRTRREEISLANSTVSSPTSVLSGKFSISFSNWDGSHFTWILNEEHANRRCVFALARVFAYRNASGTARNVQIHCSQAFLNLADDTGQQNYLRSSI